MARVERAEVATELEFLRWFYNNQFGLGPQELKIELNNIFTENFGKNPPEQYEVKDENGNILT